MCLLIAKSRGVVLPHMDDLLCGANSNPHGCGIAHWREGMKSVHIKKDFPDVYHLYVWMNKNVKVDDALLVHFRLASSGKIEIGQRHPFPISQSMDALMSPNTYSKRAMAHNGVLLEFESIGTGKISQGVSDTMVFVSSVLAKLKGAWDNNGVQLLLNAYLSNQRVAILDNRGTVTLYGLGWIEEDGLYFSNMSYMADIYSYDHTNWTWGEEECELCNEGHWLRDFYSEDTGTVRVCKDCHEFLTTLKGQMDGDEFALEVDMIRCDSQSWKQSEIAKAIESEI